MNVFEFVLGIVLIGTIGSIIRAKYGVHDGSRRERRMKVYGVRMGIGADDGDHGDDPRIEAENARLKDEVQQLKDRVKVLERIAVDKENSLAREIDDLRDR